MPDEVKKFLSDYPELLAEWNYAKNTGLDPQAIRHRTKIRAWWKCQQGHEWQALVGNRTHGSGCPICVTSTRVQKRMASLVTMAGSLATSNPILAEEWHPIKNGDLKPADVTPSSNKKVWWSCVKGHEWQASVANRSSHASSCPYCSGRRVITGVNDLATIAPWLSAEWHRTLNGNLSPADVKAGSDKKVWWQCAYGHEWMATINARYWGNGCPVCDKIRRANKQPTISDIPSPG